MKDIQGPLKQAYFSALTQTGEKAYYLQAPDEIKGAYIVFGPITVGPIPMKSGQSVNATVQVAIYTEGERNNSGDLVDVIANKVFQRLLPNDTHTLPLTNCLEMVTTELQSDNTSPMRFKGQIMSIDRVMTFQHKIFIP